MIHAFVEKNSKAIILLLLILAFCLRFYKIGEHGLAGDEKYSLFVSQFVSYEGNNQKNSVRKPKEKYFTPKEFWSEKGTADFFDSIARIDTGNGALYTYTLHYWSKIVGLADGNLRMLSLIFNLLTIFLLYLFVKKYFRNDFLALLAAFLATISPFYINYSQVARNYSMNMFFSLLATYLLLLIIEKEANHKKTWGIYVAYGFSVLACEMCHFSTFPLFFVHGIYVLLYIRDWKVYGKFIVSMLIPAVGVGLWLTSDGGRWVVDYVTNSVKVYNQMARQSPDDYLSLATLKNILKQLRYVVSSMYLLIDGFPSVFLSMKKIYALILLTFIGSGFFFVSNTISLKDESQKRLRVFLLLLSIIPLLSLIAFAYQDGNTFRIIPRYVSYAYGFNLILIALIIVDLWEANKFFKYTVYAVFIVQLGFVMKLNVSIWQDNPPRYFMSFPEPRIRNPYQFSAQKIQELYAKGDTVLYPSVFVVKEGGIDMPSYSVTDAQLTNFYLPNNSKIIQRVDLGEENKIVLKKADGRKELIFDLKGTKYRY